MDFLALTVDTDLRGEEALDLVEQLLRTEGVELARSAGSLSSTKTPTPFFSWDRDWYSRRNPVGINPFARLRSILVLAEERDGGGTRLRVKVALRRLTLFVSLFAAFSLGVCSALFFPFVWGKVLLLFLLCFVASGWILHVLPRSLVRREINGALEVRPITRPRR